MSMSPEEIERRRLVVTCTECFAVLSAEDASPETRKTGVCGLCRSKAQTGPEGGRAMRVCSYCRQMPGVRRVGIVSETKAFATWACETCQKGVDDALAALAVLKLVQAGKVSVGVLSGRADGQGPAGGQASPGAGSVPGGGRRAAGLDAGDPRRDQRGGVPGPGHELGGDAGLARLPRLGDEPAEEVPVVRGVHARAAQREGLPGPAVVEGAAPGRGRAEGRIRRGGPEQQAWLDWFRALPGAEVHVWRPRDNDAVTRILAA